METPSRIKLPVKNPQLEELLLWRDPKRSAIALGGVTAVFLLLQFARINLLQTVAYALLTLVLGCFLWNNLASFTNKPPVPVPAVLSEGIKEADVKNFAEKATAHINKGLAYARRLATGREPVLTGSVVGVLYFVGRLAGLVSIVGLAYTAVLAAFTAPKVYELKKPEIDAMIDKARAQWTSVYDKHLHKIVSKIPRHPPAKPAESSSDRKEE
ncbi:reticulon B2 [Micractinium conductrix]|uniref:Reticulon-like protein n=1 Tax=Micractinium conductrix TaxID=554055 RepID=A0A2P6VDS1_9CHLO|nr:reticulon B2 [Micractinium conductrix]|eukprot:PSC72227.1 reticulon B2 [Micractinium conductrix]